jgi:hypothetical protein
MAKSSKKSKSQSASEGEEPIYEAAEAAKEVLETTEKLILDLKELSKALRKIVGHAHKHKP